MDPTIDPWTWEKIDCYCTVFKKHKYCLVVPKTINAIDAANSLFVSGSLTNFEFCTAVCRICNYYILMSEIDILAIEDSILTARLYCNHMDI